MKLATLARQTPAGDHPLKAILRDAVITQARLQPRSLQQELGPSEIGQPCSRRVAYTLMREAKINTDIDPWASICGVAIHAWLAPVLAAVNERNGTIEWLVEQKLKIRPGLHGSCDAYQVSTGTVLDHKIVGAEPLKNYRRNGPSTIYRAQVHIYGLGWRQLGLAVNEVAIAFYPRGGFLSGLHVWAEPYDEELALRALERVDDILALVHDLNVDTVPEMYRHIPRAPSRLCMYCPWFQPGKDTGKTCPGYLKR